MRRGTEQSSKRSGMKKISSRGTLAAQLQGESKFAVKASALGSGALRETRHKEVGRLNGGFDRARPVLSGKQHLFVEPGAKTMLLESPIQFPDLREILLHISDEDPRLGLADKAHVRPRAPVRICLVRRSPPCRPAPALAAALVRCGAPMRSSGECSLVCLLHTLGAGWQALFKVKCRFGTRPKGSEPGKACALAAADSSQDVVQDAIQLIGRRSRADSGLPCQTPGELFSFHFRTKHNAGTLSAGGSSLRLRASLLVFSIDTDTQEARRPFVTAVPNEAVLTTS